MPSSVRQCTIETKSSQLAVPRRVAPLSFLGTSMMIIIISTRRRAWAPLRRRDARDIDFRDQLGARIFASMGNAGIPNVVIKPRSIHTAAVLVPEPVCPLKVSFVLNYWCKVSAMDTLGLTINKTDFSYRTLLYTYIYHTSDKIMAYKNAKDTSWTLVSWLLPSAHNKTEAK